MCQDGSLSPKFAGERTLETAISFLEEAPKVDGSNNDTKYEDVLELPNIEPRGLFTQRFPNPKRERSDEAGST